MASNSPYTDPTLNEDAFDALHVPHFRTIDNPPAAPTGSRSNKDLPGRPSRLLPPPDSTTMGDESGDPFEESTMDDSKVTVAAEQAHLLSTPLKKKPVKPRRDGPLLPQVSQLTGIEEYLGLARPLPDQEKAISHVMEDKLQKSISREEPKSSPPEQLVPSSGLGNLSSFLSTRGIVDSSVPVSNSAYFAQAEIKKPEGKEPPQSASTSTSPETILNIIPPPVPSSQPLPEKPTCFLSTNLLKTRLSHVRQLDSSSSFRLVYRDYDPKSPEADIIISPRTGIILTSAHTLTQKYLPGDKGSRADIKSPVMERIYQTTPHYETMYIFICVLSNKADEQMQDAVTNLSSFCTSLDEETTIIPMIVSETDGAVAGWIEYLAYTELPSMMPAIRPVRSQETRWEVTLRGYGLNPFAARLVLDMGMTLDSFIEMSNEKRLLQYKDLLGQRVLRRVETAIQRDKS
ncbi:uncharacterized protein N7443_000217 [Penicillium atrosanguineum]|uniref:uncharacterized protein n=1 Tax=Penicillium atrosanguineum TaxID=1132637 RepID=UPI002383CF6C|nr:uncharacterized protein N7443_000217 [Penicillium atrosanguineum]KAJ5313333.1 hypothetical protein N7443_000217 [Penicillium atrosanguineum]